MQMSRREERGARRQGGKDRTAQAAALPAARKTPRGDRPALPDLRGVASATECTGVLPALPPDDSPVG